MVEGGGDKWGQVHSSCGPWEVQSLGGQAQTTCLEDSLGPRLSSEELWKAWGKGQGAKGRFCPSPSRPHSHPLLPHTQAAGTKDPQPHSNAAHSGRAESELPRAAGSNQAGASLSCLGKTQFSCQSIERRQMGSHRDRAPASCASSEKGGREHRQSQLPKSHPGFGAASWHRAGHQPRTAVMGDGRQTLQGPAPAAHPSGLSPAQWQLCDPSP